MPDSHDFEFGSRFGDDFQVGGHGVAFDEERMIPGRGEWAGQAGKKFISGMIDGRSLAVHESFGADDFAAEDVADALVAETDAERRNFAGKDFDDVVGE